MAEELWVHCLHLEGANEEGVRQSAGEGEILYKFFSANECGIPKSCVKEPEDTLTVVNQSPYLYLYQACTHTNTKTANPFVFRTLSQNSVLSFSFFPSPSCSRLPVPVSCN